MTFPSLWMSSGRQKGVRKYNTKCGHRASENHVESRLSFKACAVKRTENASNQSLKYLKFGPASSAKWLDGRSFSSLSQSWSVWIFHSEIIDSDENITCASVLQSDTKRRDVQRCAEYQGIEIIEALFAAAWKACTRCAARCARPFQSAQILAISATGCGSLLVTERNPGNCRRTVQPDTASPRGY